MIFTVLFGIVVVSMGLATFTSMVDKMGAVPIVGGVAAGAVANFSGFVIALGVFFVYLVFLFYLLGIFVSGTDYACVRPADGWRERCQADD